MDSGFGLMRVFTSTPLEMLFLNLINRARFIMIVEELIPIFRKSVYYFRILTLNLIYCFVLYEPILFCRCYKVLRRALSSRSFSIWH